MKNKSFIPNELYKDIMDNMPICTVDIMFIDRKKDRILLFKRTNQPLKGVYYTMGGRLLKGEKYIDGAIRQAQQELNISVSADDLVYAGLTRDIHKNSAFENISYDAVVILFACEINDVDLLTTFDSQHDDKKWFSLHEALHPFIQERLRMTLSALAK